MKGRSQECLNQRKNLEQKALIHMELSWSQMHLSEVVWNSFSWNFPNALRKKKSIVLWCYEVWCVVWNHANIQRNGSSALKYQYTQLDQHQGRKELHPWHILSMNLLISNKNRSLFWERLALTTISTYWGSLSVDLSRALRYRQWSNCVKVSYMFVIQAKCK